MSQRTSTPERIRPYMLGRHVLADAGSICFESPVLIDVTCPASTIRMPRGVVSARRDRGPAIAWRVGKLFMVRSLETIVSTTVEGSGRTPMWGRSVDQNLAASGERPRGAVLRRQPGSRVPQLEQLSSVTRLPIPHEGQRFIPSVATAKGFSGGVSSIVTRSRRRIVITAAIPRAAMSTRARIWVVWSTVVSGRLEPCPRARLVDVAQAYAG